MCKAGTWYRCESLCKKYILGTILRHSIENTGRIEDAHLISGFTHEQFRLGRNAPVLETHADLDQVKALAPQGVEEKAHKLLEELVWQTQEFGQVLTVPLEVLCPVAYAKSEREALALLTLLRERRLLTSSMMVNGYTQHVSVAAEGFGAIQMRQLLPPLSVFVSSTCFDLTDLRAELAEHLESNGFIVKLSDDPDRFEVGGVDDSIETCLQNLEQSDTVVCILDRRYGGVVPDGRFEGQSATHIEVLRARELSLPVYFFIRDKAELEYRQLRRDPDYRAEWVEPGSGRRAIREKWLELAELAMKLPNSDADRYSNWRDQFKTSLDLKKVVSKRLADFHRHRQQRKE